MPAAGGAGQLAEAEPGQQPQEVPLLGPGVLEQALGPGQPQPVRRLPDQPGGDPAPPVGLDHVEVADVGPAAKVGQAPALGQVGLDLDEADQLVADQGRQPGAALPDRPFQPEALQGRRRRPGQLVDPGQQDDLDVAVVDEPGPLVQRPDVRPLLGHAVHAGGREGAVGVPVLRLPRPEPVQAGVHQRAGRLRRVGPVVRLRPAQQPVDLGGAAVGLADVLAHRRSAAGGRRPRPGGAARPPGWPARPPRGRR